MFIESNRNLFSFDSHKLSPKYQIFSTGGILFNHESSLQGRELVTCKIVASAAKIKQGELDALELGRLEAKRN